MQTAETKPEREQTPPGRDFRRLQMSQTNLAVPQRAAILEISFLSGAVSG
ncbi:unnamed protein product, partial [Allacma fusca]